MLTDLNLMPVYDSQDCDLVKDLVVPLLSNSSSYMRGVGFFTSGWLRLASLGIVSLVENGGKAKIITSPILSQNDLNAFIAGEEAKQNEILKRAIEESIDSLATQIDTNTLNALSWMIADGLLELRFAIPRVNELSGDYHDKVGIFEDDRSNVVAIHGSLNDSLKGSLNGEAFSVFKSWESGQIEYVENHKKRLTQLWDGKNKQFHSFSLPEVSKGKFLKLRTSSDRPYYVKNLSLDDTIVAKFSSAEGIHLPVKLRSYQGQAIRSWLENGHLGVLGMATGTGKTLTALSAAVIKFIQDKRIALVILVPYLHLLDQWAEDCRICGFSPILCSSEHGFWHVSVKGKIQDFNIRAIDNICIVAVHDTASSKKFEKATSKLPLKYTMLIGDEVHNLGSKKLQSSMLPIYGKRLGLSATPRRWFDEEGTRAIFKYFGEVCFEFNLDDAIGKFLTPYKYCPEKISFSCDEMEQYEKLTKKISQMSHLNHKIAIPKDDQLKKLLLDRARLVSSAKNKIPRMLSIVRELLIESEICGEQFSHALVYCAPGTHKEVLKNLSDLNIKCHEFVHNVSLKERQKLLGEFESGKIQILVAVKCLDEGVDVPSTKMAFFLSSTSNPKEFVQRRGRVLRKSVNKSEAILYDFFVVPDTEHISLKRDIDAGLLKREMPRFAEFSNSAKNQYEARQVFWDILDNYDLLHLLDEKPWEVYKKMVDQSDLIQAEEGNYV